MPGDPFTGLITPQTDPAALEELRRKAGLLDPWHIQYVRWLKNAFSGNLGMSYTYNVPVNDTYWRTCSKYFYFVAA